MNYRTLGRTGLTVSSLGLGVPSVGSDAGQRRAFKDLLWAALDAGITLIDTAACYPNSEAAIGEALAGLMHRPLLVSKCGHHEVLPNGSLKSKRITLADVDQALVRLRVDCLEVMLLHSYDRDALEQGEALGVLQQAKAQGKIRHIGYSGDKCTAAYAATLAEIDVIELSVNVLDQHNIPAVMPVVAEKNNGSIAKRSLANAFWLAGFEQRQPEYARRLRAMRLSPALLEKESGLAWPELALRFTLTVPNLSSALISTRSVANLQDNVRYARKGPLAPSDFRLLLEAFRTAASDDQAAWLAQN